MTRLLFQGVEGESDRINASSVILSESAAADESKDLRAP